MYTDGFLKISRKILDWRWYKDPNTARLFLHLMLRANHTDAEFENHKIKRGQFVTSRKRLSDELNISQREVRTAIEHLKSTNDIAVKTTSKYSIITMINYEEFQSSTNKMANKRPTNGHRATRNRPQYNKNKKDKKDNNAINNNERTGSFTLEDFESHSLFND